MAAWDYVLGVVASLLQISGVDLTMVLLLVVGALKLCSCKMERGKLKHLVADLEFLGGLQTGQHTEQAMRAAGVWESVQMAMDDANRLVDTYDSSSVFHLVCYSWRMEKDMVQAGRRVSNCYNLAVGVHAGVAVGIHAGMAVA